MKKKQPNMNVGAAILFLIFSLLFFILIFRFVSIQITGEAEGQPLAAKAEQKYIKERTIDAKRGSIFDRNGEVIAEDTTAYTLVAILDEKMTTDKDKPRHVVDKEKTAQELAKLIDMEQSKIFQLLSKDGLFQVEFGKAGRNISHQTKAEIEKLALPGITFMRDSKRFYPNGIFSSHLVGYVDKEETEGDDAKKISVGRMGIEKSFNDMLTETDGKIAYESDLWGFLLPNGEEKVTAPKDGNDIVLTIDKKIQTFLEDALNRVNEKYKPKRIMAIVADPKTGEILAMSQRPTFHPTTKDGISDTWHNEVIESSFEPGSTMKIFTLAAAIEENAFPANELYQSGSYAVGPNYIRDHNSVGWGKISFLEGVQRSSNVGFAILAEQKLGFDKFREYLTKFGFEQPTGIDLPNETTGKILYRYPLEKVTTAFGQGSAITPIQQIQAATAIANNGQMVKPHVIKEIVDSRSDKVIEKKEVKVVGTPISAKTAKSVRDILETVVTSPNGTGNRYNIEGYPVAGKTGTAQIPGPDGKYLKGHQNYLFSFLGMAPKDDPELIMYVAVEQPKIGEYESGSVPVSMIFNSVMKNSLQYLNIKPAELKVSKTITLPNVEGVSAKTAIENLKNMGVVPIVIGNGKKVVDQEPVASTAILANEKVILRTEGKLFAPDLTGWSLRDVMKFAKLSRLKLNMVGSGYVVKQNISSGSPFVEGDNLIVQFEKPLEQFMKENAPPVEETEDEEEVPFD